MLEIFILLITFQLKHFICDYPFQTPYMLQKANLTGWIKPLAAHAFIHAAFTFTLVMWFLLLNNTIVNYIYIWLPICLASADFIIHFTVDRIKASPKIGGRFKPTQPYFWWALGADQMAHHLTHYTFIYTIITLTP